MLRPMEAQQNEYKRWDGSSWVLVRSFGASSWRATGTPGLAYWNLNNDVTLEGGALVKQHLRYRYFLILVNKWAEWNGSTHNHFLE